MSVLVFVSNLRLLGFFLLVYFGEGCSSSSCDRGKTKSTPSPWTWNWSLTIISLKLFHHGEMLRAKYCVQIHNELIQQKLNWMRMNVYPGTNFCRLGQLHLNSSGTCPSRLREDLEYWNISQFLLGKGIKLII